MAVYEYECPDGHRFEILCYMKDYNELYPCPSCQQESRRIMTPFGFTFGWTLEHNMEPHGPDKMQRDI